MSVSIEWLGFAAITLSVLAYLPQITHLIKEHCSAGLSPGAYCTWVASAVLLLTYSIAKNDPVFILLQNYQAAAGSLIFSRLVSVVSEDRGSRKAGIFVRAKNDARHASIDLALGCFLDWAAGGLDCR